MYTKDDLYDAQTKLEVIRTKNKETIKWIKDEIKNGYGRHGIIYTSTALGLSRKLLSLKEEVTTLTKERNLIKKSLK